MGAGARRCVVSSSLRGLALECGGLGKAPGAWRRRTPYLPGACAMMGLLDALARPLMGLMEAENAHRFAVRALKWAPLPPPGEEDARLAMRAFGLNFPNPVGMAAGF